MSERGEPYRTVVLSEYDSHSVIERDEIDAMSETLGVHAADVQRDYVFGWLLAALYGDGLVPDGYVLKGGSCLRKGYFARTRFTRDLDFSMSGSAQAGQLETDLKEACKAIADRAGVCFDIDRTFVRKKKRVSEDLSVYEGAVYFTDFYGKQRHVSISARMDVTEFDRLHLPPIERQLIHPYSDASECVTNIRCAQLEEVLASKLKCLLQRRHVADLYDLCHWIFFHGDDIDRRAVLQVFLQKTIYQPDPGAAGELLKNLAFDSFREAWDKYILCATDVLMPFADALEQFLSMIGSLFSGSRGWGRGIFFPSEYRNPILEAGSRARLIRVVYKGVARVVEPYSLRFKRKKDGTAREYLYVHEITKGEGSTNETRQYVADRMQSIQVLDEGFDPRYPVELSSAGEYGPKRDFDRGGSLPRVLAPRRRRSKRRTSGITYVVRCPSCRRTFQRKKMNMTLKPHKDRNGNPCYGRWGSYEGTK